MGMAAKKTISLPLALLKELEVIAREEGKTISAIIRERGRKMFARSKTIGAGKPKNEGF